MLKVFLVILVTLFTYLNFPATSFADFTNSFVSVVNPVRGNDFWDEKDQSPLVAIDGEINIIKEYSIPATWLIRFDALNNQEIIQKMKNTPTNNEKGLFLEITPTWTKSAQVAYYQSPEWHFAGSVFLTGYQPSDRMKLIDIAFAKFKEVFGNYPTSVGAWWIDSYSLSYMQSKYQVTGALIVSDQFSTDNYQIWGQYFGTPYYPDQTNSLIPAQSASRKLPIVMTQWAVRDPVNGYGKGVEESTFSVQANDYIDYHNLDTTYFAKLVDIYTKQKYNQFGHLVVGLENSYSWNKYGNEYKKQLETLVNKQQANQLRLVSMEDFSKWYITNFPDLSPEQIIEAADPLGTGKKVVWFMNPYYRMSWSYDQNESSIRDLRQYVEGQEELCREKACQELNFATFATRVLDNVTYGHTFKIDEGKITDFSLTKEGEIYLIKYLNEVGKKATIELHPRDISINGKISTIDGLILSGIQQSAQTQQNNQSQNSQITKNNPQNFIVQIGSLLKFLLFLIIAIFIPGLVIISRISDDSKEPYKLLLLSLGSGIVQFTLISFLAGLVKSWWLIYLYVGIFVLLFIRQKLLKTISLGSITKLGLINFGVILLGTIFQVIPVYNSGSVLSNGIGFWGPNSHDGIWHIALVNQLLTGLPPQNPIFSGVTLQNYHYLYDLLIATTHIITQIQITDLIFRLYPIAFSLLLGLGVYYLSLNLFKSQVATIFSLYIAYFCGSFGWIVELIRERHWGGESAFWANQSISFNLNPPFALSLVLVLVLLNLFFIVPKNKWALTLVVSIICGSLVGFKAYAAIVILLTLVIVGVINLFTKKDGYLLMIFSGALFISLGILLPNYRLAELLNSKTAGIFMWSPFWFIHSMVDSPDRVGWTRLSLARMVGLSDQNWFKFISAELIGLILFIGGNLGMRILSIGIIFKNNFDFKSTGIQILLVSSLLFMLIPLLFIQKGNPWNSIQFIYYFLYVTAILAGGAVFRIYKSLPKFLNILFVIIIFVLTPINAITTMRGYLSKTPHALVSSGELEALTHLVAKPAGVVLTMPFEPANRKKFGEPLPIFAYETTAYVSAFSGKPVFVDDNIQNDILGTDYKSRVIQSKNFINNTFPKKEKFIKDNNIKYVYLPKKLGLERDAAEYNSKIIFENNDAILYEIIN